MILINGFTSIGLHMGSAALNFPVDVAGKIGLVGTYSIHNSIQNPYIKTQKSSGLSEVIK
ncbi:MAG: hypothetical protein K9H48_17615 [Melioribacteraceae bacterium]|nr:hypothetical protein [Melioribacteraceae bacterium]MCF8395722.1 hypothetical protein [Melioribacteraceae bacterium]MCF8421206.1 hypothetical protein [Melioribacteraceae bacterium]